MKPIRIVLAPTRSRPLNIFLGLALVLVSLLLFLALASWRASDPSLNTATAATVARNWTGLAGAYSSDLLLQSLGISAFLIPLWLGCLGWTWMRSRASGSPILRWIGTLFALVFLPAVFGLLPWQWRWMHVIPIEGVAGRLVSSELVAVLNVQGAWVVAGVLAAAGLYFSSAISLLAVRESLANQWENFAGWRERRRELRQEREEERLAERLAEQKPAGPAVPVPPFAEDPAPRTNRLLSLFGFGRKPQEDPLDEVPAFRRNAPFLADLPAKPQAPAPIPISSRKPSIWERATAAPPAPEPVPEPAAQAAVDDAPVAGPVPEPIPVSIPPQMRPAPPVTAPVNPWADEPESNQHSTNEFLAAEPEPVTVQPVSVLPPAPLPPAPAAEPIAVHARTAADVRTVTVAPKRVSGYKLPSTDLLNPGEGPQSVRSEELREDARVLVDKCAEFDVRGQVVQINPGPMVTTFEFKPEAGVKYSRVTGLADDLCLAMSAESILIERIPGKSTVGIQIPNRVRETIHVREVLESESFQKAKAQLTLALGKDINGVRVACADLAALPHVLIAGSTGSGKSVAINAMILSLLYRSTPDQVRLILVDPKRVELGMYEGIPHLFTPIITEPKLAANALRNAVREMERRLRLLASRSVRNLEQYNRLFESSAPSLFEQEPENENEGPLPYIVIIIDELADLMMLDRANVEESVTRLAQMSRAVGIHLVLATQRPSVDVITGLIKANVPTRISFRLATKVDSRTIIDTNGAESLLGRGDMLYLPPGTSRLTRLHAPLVTEKEVAAVVDFWKAQGAAEYAEGFLESPKDEAGAASGASDAEDNDPMFDDAVRVVFKFGKASTSLLQRQLRIGYGRAAHLIDMMERDGLVGAPDGPRPRELLKSPGWLNEVVAAGE